MSPFLLVTFTTAHYKVYELIRRYIDSLLMASSYEINILNQPAEWKRLLSTQLPSELKNIRHNRIIFVGIGSSYCIACLAKFLWTKYVTNVSTISDRTFSRVEPLSVERC
jgi:hypothetical protein